MSTSELNAQQYEAVFHRGGPLLVLAGAGSGKTRVITERIAALVERDVPEDAIAAVTFTNKAAREMRQRLQARLGDVSKKLRICTFHSLGLAIVRKVMEDHGGNIELMDAPDVTNGVEGARGALMRLSIRLASTDSPDETTPPDSAEDKNKNNETDMSVRA